MAKVKICGITCLEDALTAVDAGAEITLPVLNVGNQRIGLRRFLGGLRER